MLNSALLLFFLSVLTFAAEPAAKPDAQLLRLEAALTQKLDERKSGAVPPDQYRLFAEQFRVDLDAALARAPKTPLNTGRHAMILARLDESGPSQAIAGLDRALETDSGSAELLLAKGSIQLEKGDYAGALAAADAVLKGNAERGENPDPAAVSLRQFSKGRVTPTGQRPTAAPSPPFHASAAADSSGRQEIQFTPREARARVEVPSISGGDESREAGIDRPNPGFIDRALVWTQGKIEGAQQDFVRWVGRKVGFRPGEEEAALKGSMDGAILGTGIGGVVGAVGMGLYCSPGVATGGPFAKCILAGGAGGVIVGSVAGASFGGTLAVIKKRSSVEFDKAQGKETESE